MSEIMTEKRTMRILTAYNGTEFARAAIEDLTRAGMPSEAQTVVMTVAEPCFPTVEPRLVQDVAAEGATRVGALFPRWQVTTNTCAGAAIREIVAFADKFRPDLVVLGEPNNEVFLGPVCQGLLTDSAFALRIARKPQRQPNDRPPRLLVGFDGSDGAMLAIETIVNRTWPEGTSVRLLSIDNTGVLGTIGRLSPQMRAAAVGAGFASHWAETLASRALKLLSDKGIDAAIDLVSGHPQDALINAAQESKADCIFVGPHSAGNSFERYLLGSVSATVAARANCTVEVVR
jgi:nucleotide-binding universal stress UspA family protein